MKVYFLIIIIILVVVIFLLFYLIYKIYILHVKSYEDGEFDEEEAPLSLADEVDAGPQTEAVQSSQESISTKTGSSSMTDETATSAVQPHVKSMLGPMLHSVTEDFMPKNGSKEKCCVTILFEYNADEEKLFATLLDASNLPKAKSGSSEPYVDMQISPYKHRTYRPPGFRRPLRGCLKRPVDLTLQQNEVNVHYFILYLLRYDPFSRLAVDGEMKIPLSKLDRLLEGESITTTEEVVESNQQFTGFIFRHGSGSTRSLNGSNRSASNSPSGIRRSFDDSSRASSKSFNGFSRALDESSFRRHGLSNGHHASSDDHNGSNSEHKASSCGQNLTQSQEQSSTAKGYHHGNTLSIDDRFHTSSRSFHGTRSSHDSEDFGPTGLTRSRTEKPRRKRRGAMTYSPLAQ